MRQPCILTTATLRRTHQQVTFLRFVSLCLRSCVPRKLVISFRLSSRTVFMVIHILLQVLRMLQEPGGLVVELISPLPTCLKKTWSTFMGCAVLVPSFPRKLCGMLDNVVQFVSVLEVPSSSSQVQKAACDKFDPSFYSKFKSWCDDYFLIKVSIRHSKELERC